MAAQLTADQVIIQFEALIDDSIDQTTELFLLNEVKDTIEAEREWAILTGLDVSKTVPAVALTPINLPVDFGMPSPRGIYVKGDLIPYRQVPFEGQIDFQAITYAYFLDYYNAQYTLCGTPTPGSVVQFFYRRTSPTMALAANGGQPWIFPARFHPRLVYEMAIKYFAIDQGDKGRAWDDRWQSYATMIAEAMNSWDDQLQTLALQNESDTMVRDLSGYPTIIDMDSGSPGGSMFG